jgi:hypothetical protein
VMPMMVPEFNRISLPLLVSPIPRVNTPVLPAMDVTVPTEPIAPTVLFLKALPAAES